MTRITKNTVCLWYERDAEEAALFYARTFPDSSVATEDQAETDRYWNAIVGNDGRRTIRAHAPLPCGSPATLMR